MIWECCLAPDINKCPNYIADTGRCAAGNEMCGFFNSYEKREKTEYKRKTRWYEKYYKR